MKNTIISIIFILITLSVLSCKSGSIKSDKDPSHKNPADGIYFEETFNAEKAALISFSSSDIKISQGQLVIPVPAYGKNEVSIRLSIPEDSPAVISFKYLPDMVSSASLTLTLISSGSSTLLSEIKGSDYAVENWKSSESIVPGGEITIVFTIENQSGYYSPEKSNALILDDIFVVKNVPSRLELPYRRYISTLDHPLPDFNIKRPDNLPFSGSPGESVKYYIKSESGEIEISSPSSLPSGQYTLFAKYGDISSNSIKFIVPSQDSLYYQDKFYMGAYPDPSSEPLIENPDSPITLLTPFNISNSADGFFKIAISISDSAPVRYALLLVSSPSGHTDKYYLKDKEPHNAFLRYGPGTYTVELCQITSIRLSKNGFIKSAEYNAFPVEYCFKVNNKADTSPDLSPSDSIQASDYRIQNLSEKIVYNPEPIDDYTKLKLITSFIAEFLSYDFSSLTPGNRNPQDALTVLKNKAGVCEGYVSLTLSLLRCQQIRSRMVVGFAESGKSDMLASSKNEQSANHAWIHIIPGGNISTGNDKKLLLDPTWCDPVSADTGVDSSEFSSKYFLLDDLSGINNSHSGEEIEN